MKNTESNPCYCKGENSAGEDMMKKTSFFIVFVDGNAFGLEVKEAQTIFKAGNITPIPLVREEIAGFINLSSV